MLELSVIPETGFVCLDQFCKNPTFNEGQVILFDNDKDFLAFCVHPVAVAVMDKDGNPLAFNGQYTEMYQKCLDAGMKFGIRDEKSLVKKHKVANTNVLIPEGFNQLRKEVYVHLPVQGIEDLREWYYLYDGEVYNRMSIVARLVYCLVYQQGKTEAEVRTILKSCCKDVLSDEQFNELDKDGKEQFKSFSIKRVKYHFRKMSYNDLISVAAENDIKIDPLVIK